MENVSPVCTSVNSILNQSGVVVAVGTAADCFSDVEVTILWVGLQADPANTQLNRINARQNDFTLIA
jgi:hypothetical protein